MQLAFKFFLLVSAAHALLSRLGVELRMLVEQPVARSFGKSKQLKRPNRVDALDVSATSLASFVELTQPRRFARIFME